MGKFACYLDFGEHGSEDFESWIFLVTQPICASLYDADFVVESLDEAK